MACDSDTDCYGFPKEVGLYSPDFERSACGVGFIVNIDGARDNEVLFICLAVVDDLTCCFNRVVALEMSVLAIFYKSSLSFTKA